MMRATLALGLLVIGLALGQERLEFREVERIEGPASDVVAGIIDRIPHLSIQATQSPAAQEMLTASARGSERFITWKLPSPAGSATMVHHDLDILVAHWEHALKDGLPNDLWMWDDPLGSYFFLPLPESRVADRAGFRSLLDSLLVWWEPPPPTPVDPEPVPETQPEPQSPPSPPVPFPTDDPVPPPPPPPPPARLPKLKPQSIRVGCDPRFRSAIFTLARVPNSDGLVGKGSLRTGSCFQQSGPGQFLFSELYRRDGRDWLIIAIGNRWMQTPHDTFRVAERFPPLRERVPDWSTERLLAEIGRELIPDRFGSAERDSILLNELVKRDITLGDAYNILNRSSHGHVYPGRGVSIVEALVKSGKSKAFESFIREQIVDSCAGPQDRLSSPSTSMLFALQDVHAIDVSDLAVECLSTSHSNSIFESLRYLKARAHTRTVYDALQSTSIPPLYEQDKQLTLSTIKARIP